MKETRNWLITRYIRRILYTFICDSTDCQFDSSCAWKWHSVNGCKVRAFSGTDYCKGFGGKNVFCVQRFVSCVSCFFYKVLPNRKATFKSQVPGAFITAVAWSAFSYFFSLYFEIFPGFSNTYGNLTALILVMLWMYVCMNLMLYGAEINAYFETEFRKAQASVRDMLNRERGKEDEKGLDMK